MVGRQAPRVGAPTWTLERLFAIFPNLRELRAARARACRAANSRCSPSRARSWATFALLLDEPSEGLAPRIVEQMIEAIREMKREVSAFW